MRKTLGMVAVAAAATALLTTSGAEAGLPPQMTVKVQPVQLDEQPRVQVHVPVPAGVENPAGWVLLDVTRQHGGYHVQRFKSWSGDDVRFTVHRVTKPGRYLVHAIATSEGMRDSARTVAFRVTR